LLISGGHTLLAVVRSVDEFEYIGGTDAMAIGDFLDKVTFLLSAENKRKTK